MCEAFAQMGLQVFLWYIPSPTLQEDVLDFYGVRTRFALKPLRRAILPLRKDLVWNGWRKFPSYLHALLWSGLVAYAACRYQADLYFTREIMVAWWMRRFKLPTVLEIHNCPGQVDRNLLVATSMDEHVRLIISVTEHLRQDLARVGIPISKVLTLHDGVDLDRFNPGVSKQVAREKLGLQWVKDLVVYCGQLYPEKGVDTLIEAASKLSEVVFVLVGGQPEDVRRLEKLATQLKARNIVFTGYKYPLSIPIYLKAADLLVIPQSACSRWSAYYTSPMKVFEYMSSGRAIVGTKVPCLMEVLKDRENAWLVRPDDPLALAKGISIVLENPDLAGRLGLAASRSASDYTWELRAHKVVKAFEGMSCS